MDPRYERINEISRLDLQLLQTKKVLIVGAGGLGNFTSLNLALNGIGELIIVDKDVVEISNLTRSPLFCDRDIGEPKAEVVAKNLKLLNGEISITPLVGDVRNVGLGYFRAADIVLMNVDNRRARQIASSNAWKMNTPFLDAGIDGESLSGLVRVFLPGLTGCLECSFYKRDYELVGQSVPCQPRANNGSSVPTLSTIASIIAGIQATEALKILLGHREKAQIGREVRIDTMNYKLTTSLLPKKADCLFDHHQIIDQSKIVKLDQDNEDLTLGELLEIASQHLKTDAIIDLGRDISVEQICTNCSRQMSACYSLNAASSKVIDNCQCGGQLQTIGTAHCFDHKSPSHLLESSLASLGVPQRDIVRAQSGEKEIYFEFPLPAAVSSRTTDLEVGHLRKDA